MRIQVSLTYNGLAALPDLELYRLKCEKLSVEPFQVRLKTYGAITCTDPPALDSILAKGMHVAEMQGRRFPDSTVPFYLPLPLLKDRDIEGLPLWKTTDFLPIEPASYLTHIHRRPNENTAWLSAIRATLKSRKPRRQPNSAAGQYMSYRVPRNRVLAKEWIATGVGNIEEVRRLLSFVQAVGKDVRAGQGKVYSWTVEPMNLEFSFTNDEGGYLRPVPTPTGIGIVCGWTPPYWLRPTWRECEVSVVNQLLYTSC